MTRKYWMSETDIFNTESGEPLRSLVSAVLSCLCTVV